MAAPKLSSHSQIPISFYIIYIYMYIYISAHTGYPTHSDGRLVARLSGSHYSLGTLRLYLILCARSM